MSDDFSRRQIARMFSVPERLLESPTASTYGQAEILRAEAAAEAMVAAVRRFVADHVVARPVAVRLSRARMRQVEAQLEARRSPERQAQPLGGPPSLLGLRLEEVANAEDDFGEVEYSDGSRRPI